MGCKPHTLGGDGVWGLYASSPGGFGTPGCSLMVFSPSLQAAGGGEQWGGWWGPPRHRHPDLEEQKQPPRWVKTHGERGKAQPELKNPAWPWEQGMILWFWLDFWGPDTGLFSCSPPPQGERFEFPAVEDDVIYDDVPCENLDADQDGRGSSPSWGHHFLGS